LASMRIASVKNQVLESQQFFSEIWHIYQQLRVDSLFRFGRTQHDDIIKKQLYIIITAEGGFGGDIDQKLIKMMLADYNQDKQDIVVIGHHGALLLLQQHVGFKKYFTLPSRDHNINVRPLVQEVRRYESTAVFYQTYVSLMVQEGTRIELQSAVAAQGREVGDKAKESDMISEDTYIFEPSTFDVVAHLERSMTEIALSQVILDSKLAQYAARFRAMSMAKDRANELVNDLRLEFNRTKRHIQDERLKEMINGMRMGGQ
jgi:F-type H+-transporting ATPase subunit gamma